MPDTKIYNRALHSSNSGTSSCEERSQELGHGGTAELDSKSTYFVASPNGTQVPIPKELYVAFSDFIKTRKCPGSIAIQYRSGEIICVEALARKTYRNNS
ncbi:MAG TPA: hypothetical protein VKY85_27240 [Candidatus Angelobacter sp.]|nr:hypothetical protein [Candidatus Angelobacter sp.]